MQNQSLSVAKHHRPTLTGAELSLAIFSSFTISCDKTPVTRSCSLLQESIENWPVSQVKSLIFSPGEQLGHWPWCFTPMHRHFVTRTFHNLYQQWTQNKPCHLISTASILLSYYWMMVAISNREPMTVQRTGCTTQPCCLKSSSLVPDFSFQDPSRFPNIHEHTWFPLLIDLE